MRKTTTGYASDCPCGDSIETNGHDESSRNSVRHFQGQHLGHTRAFSREIDWPATIEAIVSRPWQDSTAGREQK